MLLLPTMFLCPLNIHLHGSPRAAALCCHQPSWREILNPSSKNYRCVSGKHSWQYRSVAKSCCNGWLQCLAPHAYGRRPFLEVDVATMVFEGLATKVVLVPADRHDVIQALAMLLPFERRSWPPMPSVSRRWH